MQLALLGLLVFLAQSADDYPKFVVPNQPDLTITTRRTFGPEDAVVQTQTLLFQGARSKQEIVIRSHHRADQTHAAWITQCDERRTLLLNQDARLYAYTPAARDLEYYRTTVRRKPVAVEEPSGPDVPVTIDAVDTGERRQMAGLTARHVVTTTKTGPGGDYSEVETRVQDGWYVDLPPGDCVDWGGPSATMTASLTLADAPRFRFHITHLRTARRGFPLIETDRSVTTRRTVTSTTELVEVSDRPLDPALFDIPPGYRPALRRWAGDFDMSRPDTLINRVRFFVESASDWVHRIWR
jgi:hypothetical protein